jgi:hypothetical protein
LPDTFGHALAVPNLKVSDSPEKSRSVALKKVQTSFGYLPLAFRLPFA